ncbi:transposase [Oceanicoccus sp. KOV_DT_Chl]|uniref:transposase n=1 Tax=Oceanicoccus sp. KOV_DT_Chl TaxID=1904639 RepID=UPI000C7C0609|nr:transposase [Oceanicoccus sp. KOV_DT_Chl]
MPRKIRMYLPGVPAHIVQRGNNRNACFFSDDDYFYYKHILGEGLRRYGGQLHAYCLMTNHVHLIITPTEKDSISRIIQHTGRQYVQYINKTYQRSGTLWEGRHKGSLVDAEQYLLACYRYVELNPVVAGMVNTPDEYPWSSYRCNAWGEVDDLVIPHSIYQSVGLTEFERLQSYRELFSIPTTEYDVHFIHQSVKQNLPTGNNRFKEEIEAALGRKVGRGLRGRPVKAD